MISKAQVEDAIESYEIIKEQYEELLEKFQDDEGTKRLFEKANYALEILNWVNSDTRKGLFTWRYDKEDKNAKNIIQGSTQQG